MHLIKVATGAEGFAFHTNHFFVVEVSSDANGFKIPTKMTSASSEHQ